MSFCKHIEGQSAAQGKIKWDVDKMMLALRRGHRRRAFLEAARVELDRAPLPWLRDNGSPDEMFETIENSLIAAGQNVFGLGEVRDEQY
eukprot:1974518-Pyramimonas_sp.AAC.1